MLKRLSMNTQMLMFYLSVAEHFFSFPAGPCFTKDSSTYSERTLSAGETLFVEAEYLAYPLPLVKLTSETESQLNEERVECTVVGNKVRFVIQETKSEDSGKYGVVLENSFGMAVLGIKVNVLCEDFGFRFPRFLHLLITTL